MDSLLYSNVYGNSTFWTQFHNLVGGRDLSWKLIRRTHYLERQFAGSFRTEFEVVRFPYADGELSRTEFLLS